MRMLTKCPDCRIGIALSMADADRRKHCPRCGMLFSVPDTESLGKALDRVRAAGCDVYVDQQGNLYG